MSQIDGPTVFRDDDAGYLRWILDNPSGLVLNSRRTPTPDYLVLHKATCGSISTTSGNTFMGSYMKICAHDESDLERWAHNAVMGVIRPCGLCSPRGGLERHRHRNPVRKTVWEMLEACVDDLREPFGRREILRWFAFNYPDAHEATISAHIQFATSNAPVESRGTFAYRTPLVTRISRGKYRRFVRDARPLTTPLVKPPARSELSSRVETPYQYDVVLVGCGKAKQLTAYAAEDLYTSPGFALRRASAQRLGNSWFILSAEHGLVQPHQLLEPYDTYLANMPAAYRDAWGAWSVCKLTESMGDLTQKDILVLAPGAYADAIRPYLSRAGAKIHEPLANLRQGEQLAWLSQHASGVYLADPADEQQWSAPKAHGHEVVDGARIASTILDFRARSEVDGDPYFGSAISPEALQVLTTNPWAFLISVILDEGIPAERAWQGPSELLRRLGHLDPCRMAKQHTAVQAAVQGPPALHRFVGVMADAITDGARLVCEEYGGDAARIWAPGSSAAQVEARLLRFTKIGPKKSAMAVEILCSRLGVPLIGLESTNVAYDVHVRRVFLRTGIVDRDDINVVKRAARELHPSRPGWLDLPTWQIGRGWCHSSNPECATCPLTGVCPKLIHRNI